MRAITTDGLCTIDGCGGKHHARGLCARHAHRLVRYGDPSGGGTFRSRTIRERIDRLVDRSAGLFGCWPWLGTKSRLGYGTAATKVAGRTNQAHRVVYEALVGPIPTGLELDHLCRNTSCVNPSHLEPVTHAENMRRMGLARSTPGCIRAGCDEPAKGRGLCASHYNDDYYRRHGDRIRRRARERMAI